MQLHSIKANLQELAEYFNVTSKNVKYDHWNFKEMCT